MKKYNPLLLSILSGILLWAAWPTSPAFGLIFIAFVPLLFAEDMVVRNHKKTGRKVFMYAYLTFLIWNVLATWWVSNASLWGGVFAIVANAALMTIPFLLFHHTKKIIGERLGLFSLLAFWIGFEYVHLSWEFTWSWLTIGNVFANYPNVVQWYEYTGALGGTLWVLLLNVSIFIAIKNYARMQWRALMRPLFLLVAPIAISYSLIPKENENAKSIEVAVIQPNIDSYTQKFRYNARTDEENVETFMPYSEQLDLLIKETEKIITPQTAFVFWPETSIPKGHWEESLDSDEMIRAIQQFVNKYDKLTLIAGTTTYKAYDSKSQASESARYSTNLGYYDYFNTSLQIAKRGKLNVYHKSKLVPGVERLPYPGLFSFLEYFAIDLGGAAGTLGMQKERTVFFNKEQIGVAPSVCYESIFGAYVGEWVENGAQLIGIITNDNWWDDTQGYKQHFQYARLRAVEHRRAIARSANTGISGFIKADGSIGEILTWCKRGGLVAQVNLNTEKTYYTLHGDYIGRIASFIAIAFMLSSIVKRKTTKKAKVKTEK